MSKKSPEIYDFEVTDILGNQVSLADYRGKVLLIVNTASKCGFTPQYKGLEKLFSEYQKKGLVVLGFPCNQFGKQEPGSEEDISAFCEVNYGVSFPLFAKVEVNGNNSEPLYNFLKTEALGLLGSKKIKWNFTKFLVDQEGKVIKRYAPTDSPSSIEKNIVSLLR